MIDLRLGDCLSVLRDLPAGSVQTCVTSPPYFGLRDYGTAKWDGGEPGCDHNPQKPDGGDREDRALPLGRGGLYKTVCGKCGAVRIDDQIGLEESPEQYIDKLVQVFREVKRVLKDDGTLWLNLGDSYAGSWGNYGGQNRGNGKQREITKGSQAHQKSYDGLEQWKPPTANVPGLKPKDLLMIPARVALALQADGWYLRSEIIWHKPNPMPESVRDRPTKAHEMIYLLAKNQRYFYDAEAVREPMSEATKERDKHGFSGAFKGQFRGTPNEKRWQDGRPIEEPKFYNPAGRNRRDVWTVTTKPYKEAHFATFPPDLIEPCILAGTSERGECPKCGRAWVRVVEKEPAKEGIERGKHPSAYRAIQGPQQSANGGLGTRQVFTTGWSPSCSCVDESDHNGPFEPIPQMVLDPFNGSGTTGAVAVMHGRNYVGIELNPAYIELTQKRLQGTEMVMPLAEAAL